MSECESIGSLRLVRSFVRSQFSLQLRRETTPRRRRTARVSSRSSCFRSGWSMPIAEPLLLLSLSLSLPPLHSSLLFQLRSLAAIALAKDSAISTENPSPCVCVPLSLLPALVKSPVIEGAVAETAKQQLTFCPFRVLRSEMEWLCRQSDGVMSSLKRA